MPVAPVPENNAMKSRILRACIAFTLAVSLGSCARYSIGVEDFVKQAAQDQCSRDGHVFVFAFPFAFARTYRANNLTKILCRNKAGELVYLYPNQNTQWEFRTKGGESVKMYFDTMTLTGTKVAGLRSRILSIPSEIEVGDIQEIKIYAEFPRTEKAPLD